MPEASDWSRDRRRGLASATASRSTWRAGWRARRASFVGGSAGMAPWVAIEEAQEGRRPTTWSWCCSPDTGERYLSKVHNDEWMRDNHLLDPTDDPRRRAARPASRPAATRCSRSQAADPVRRALALVRQYDVSQLPVLDGDRVVGTVYDADDHEARCSTTPRALDRPVRDDRWSRRCRSWRRTSRSTRVAQLLKQKRFLGRAGGRQRRGRRAAS